MGEVKPAFEGILYLAKLFFLMHLHYFRVLPITYVYIYFFLFNFLNFCLFGRLGNKKADAANQAVVPELRLQGPEVI